MTITTYMANKALDLFFGSQSYTVPSTIYAGMATAVTSTGGVTGEPSTASGYARVAVTNDDVATVWSTASAGVKKNTNSTIQFPTVTSSAWGTLTCFFLSDGSTAGNILWYTTAMTPSIAPTIGMAPFIDTENLTITVT